MNRRTILGAALAAAPMFNTVAARNAQNLESRWDETSNLYGTAWDMLPKAEDGTVQLLHVQIGFKSKYGRQLMGIVHNATDKPQMLADLISEDGLIGLLEAAQWIVQPGAYGLAQGFALFPLESEDDIPPVEPVFISPDEAYGPFREFAESVPLRVEATSFELDDDNDEPKHRCTATLTNTSDIDPKGAPPIGMIMFVDENGTPTMTTGLSSSDVVGVGETVDAESTIYFDFDPTQPFLIGFNFVP